MMQPWSFMLVVLPSLTTALVEKSMTFSKDYLTDRSCVFLLCSTSPIEQPLLSKHDITSTLGSNPDAKFAWNQCTEGRSQITENHVTGYGVSGETSRWPKCKQGVQYLWAIKDYEKCSDICHDGTCKKVASCHVFSSTTVKWDEPDVFDGLSNGIKALDASEIPK